MIEEQKIDDLLSRGVASFIDPEGKFKEKLLKKAKGEYPGDIIIKFGVDPTRPDLHLGHAVVLQKLRKFQDLGCKVVFLVGDFTAAIGDPTGKSKVRPEIEQEQVEANMKTYLDQVGKILSTDAKVFSWIRNSDWFIGVSDLIPKEGLNLSAWGRLINPTSFLGKALLYEKTRMQVTHLKKENILGVTLRSIFWTLKHITHAQLIERDMFQGRLKEEQALYMHEMLYPVLQGVDSFAIYYIYGACDLEIGGTDQTFNMLMGRTVMKVNKQPEQAVISMDILVGTDGKEKMSKSLDNYIGVTDEPRNIFGKVMSIPDIAILNYYELCTSADSKRLEEIKKKLENSNINPRDIKLELAQEIVFMYHGQKEATAATESFIATFQKKEIPEDIEEIIGVGNLGVLLKLKGIVSSMTDWRRLVSEGAVKRLKEGGVEEKITNDAELATPGTYKIGKRRFVRIV